MRPRDFILLPLTAVNLPEVSFTWDLNPREAMRNCFVFSNYTKHEENEADQQDWVPLAFSTATCQLDEGRQFTVNIVGMNLSVNVKGEQD